MDEPIRLERQGHIALLTLNRPNTLNAMGERIAVNPPHALRWAKQLMMSGRHTTLDTALDEAGPLPGRAHHTRNHREAVAAFFGKRAPHFTGA